MSFDPVSYLLGDRNGRTSAGKYVAGEGISISENKEISIQLDGATGLGVSPSGLSLALADSTTAGAISSADKQKLDTLNKGVANGVAGLDSAGKVPPAQLPFSRFSIHVYPTDFSDNHNAIALGAGYHFSADVTVTGLPAGASAKLTLDPLSLYIAERAGLCATGEITAGTLRIYAKTNPTGTLSGVLEAISFGTSNGKCSINVSSTSLLPRIIISNTASDANVSATNGATTVIFSLEGEKWVGDIPDYGDWTVSVSAGGQSEERTVSVTEVKTYELSIYCASRVFGSNPWSLISKISQDGNAQNYWSIGATKIIKINGTVGTSLINDSYSVFIANFGYYGGATGIVLHGFQKGSTNVCLVDGYEGSAPLDGTKAYQWNHRGPGAASKNYGGWKGCDLRYDVLGSTDTPPSFYGVEMATSRTGYDASSTTATNPVPNTLMAALPADLRAVMRPMTIYTDNVGNRSTSAAPVTASVDYLPLLAEYEVSGKNSRANSNEAARQTQLAYYANGNSKIKRKHSSSGFGTEGIWLLRSPAISADSVFCAVLSGGGVQTIGAASSEGLAPMFMV